MPDLLVFGIVFLLSLALRIWYNYFDLHINNFAACDAYEYLDNAHRLFELQSLPASLWINCLSCLTGTGSADTWLTVRSALAPLKDFHISGPIFPLYLALSLAVTGGTKLPLWAQWDNLLAVQVVLSSVTASLLALVARDAYDRKVGLLSGLLAALYPGFIVNSGRLYSESFAAFLLVALCLLTSRSFRPGGSSWKTVVLSGVVAAALQLTRSIMAVFSLALLVLNVIRQSGTKRRVSAFLTFICGFALVMAPWIAFQKLAFGSAGLVVDRVGHYNFFIGNNTEIGGWLSYPYPDGSGVDEKSFPQLLSEAVGKNPQRWLKLMLDKPERLFKFPWNDFKTAIGPFTHQWQVLFHQLLLVMAGLGLCFALTLGGKTAPSKEQIYRRTFLATLLFFHCVYFLFITVPRYNLTAMPELIVFAAAGMAILAGLIKEKSGRKAGFVLFAALAVFFLISTGNLVPILLAVDKSLSPQASIVNQGVLRFAALMAVIFAAWRAVPYFQGNKAVAKTALVVSVLLLAPLLCLPNRANGRWYEWSGQLSLARGELGLKLQLPASEVKRLSGRRLFVMIDTEGVRQQADGLSVSVNGTKLEAPVISGMSLVEGFDRMMNIEGSVMQREGERMWDSLTGAAGIGNLDLRQWSLIEIPLPVVQSALERAQAGGSVARFNVGLSNNSMEPLTVFGSYDCRTKELLIPTASVYSWEKTFYGVEENSGLTDTRYDLKVAAANARAYKLDQSDSPGIQNGYWNIRLLLAPPVVNAPSSIEQPPLRFPLGATSISPVKSFAASRAFPPPAMIGFDSVCFVKLSGKVRRRQGNVGVELSLLGTYVSDSGGKRNYASPWVPRRLRLSNEWTDFAVAVPMKAHLEHESLQGLSMQLATVDPVFGFLNVKNRKHDGEVEFSDLRLELSQQPANPLGLGHIVY